MASGLSPIKQFLESAKGASFTDDHACICHLGAEAKWICDTCIKTYCENVCLDRFQTVDEMLTTLPEGIRFAHINICSILNKLDQIKILLRNGVFDILAVTESKLDSSIVDLKIKVEGYTVERRDRKRNGGGVLMYINDKWNVTSPYADESLELLTVDIGLQNSPNIKVGVVYRPPSASAQWKTDFIKEVEVLSNTQTELVIMGDLNIDLQSGYEDFEIKMQEKGFTQLIKENTRVTSTTKTIIDHIYVNNPDEVAYKGVIPFGVSDHHMVYLIRKGIRAEAPPDRVYVKYRDGEIVDENALIDELEKVNWSLITSSSYVNIMWTTFCTKFMEVVDKYMPIKKHRFRSDAEKWVNEDSLEAMKQREKLHHQALKSSRKLDWKLYNAAKVRVVAKLNAAKTEFVEESLNKTTGSTTPEDAWIKLNRSLVPHSVSVKPTFMKMNEDTFSDSKDIANALNEFFLTRRCELAQEFERKSLPQRGKDLMPKGSFSIPNITIDDIKNAIVNLSDSLCIGLDGISVKMLKTTVNVIAPVLESIINKSLESGEVPSEWKKARVSPRFKAGDKFLIENYQPSVSVLPVISKILEGHIFNTFFRYLNNENLLKIHPINQAKETVLHCIVDNWLKNRDSKKLTGALFPALCKPFDMVNHKILLQKLSSFGICENSHKWFESYLTGRTQCVRWKGVYSDEKNVTIGVPKSSKLGGLLFTLFMNDYPDCLVHSEVAMYKGEIALSFSNASVLDIRSKLCEDLSKSMSWMKKNMLTMDLEKTKSMLIGPERKLRDKKFLIKIENHAIKKYKSIIFLGVKIDRQLTWSNHIKFVLNKISLELDDLKQMRKFLSKEAALKIYNTVIFPYFEYCCTIWCLPRRETFIEELSERQKTAVSIISKEKVTKISSTHFHDLKLMPVESFFKFQKLMLLFKILYLKESQEYKYLNLKWVDQVSTKETRNRNKCKLYEPKARTEYYKQSFKISSASLWNSLPESVRECTSLETFETECQRYLNGN